MHSELMNHCCCNSAQWVSISCCSHRWSAPDSCFEAVQIPKPRPSHRVGAGGPVSLWTDHPVWNPGMFPQGVFNCCCSAGWTFDCKTLLQDGTERFVNSPLLEFYLLVPGSSLARNHVWSPETVRMWYGKNPGHRVGGPRVVRVTPLVSGQNCCLPGCWLRLRSCLA